MAVLAAEPVSIRAAAVSGLKTLLEHRDQSYENSTAITRLGTIALGVRLRPFQGQMTDDSKAPDKRMMHYCLVFDIGSRRGDLIAVIRQGQQRGTVVRQPAF